MDESPGEQESQNIEAKSQSKNFAEMDFFEQKAAIEEAVSFLEDAKLRKDLENREEYVLANQILNQAAETEIKRREKLGGLKIELNTKSQAAEVAEVTDTDFFKKLKDESVKIRITRAAAEVGIGIVEAKQIIESGNDPYGMPLNLEEKNKLENSLQTREASVQNYLAWLRQQTTREEFVIQGEAGETAAEIQAKSKAAAEEIASADFMEKIAALRRKR